MNDMRANSVYLDAINETCTYEVRVTVNNESSMDMRTVSDADAESYAQSTANSLQEMGLDVREAYALHHPSNQLIVVQSVVQGQNVIMCMTGTDTEIITIVLSGIYNSEADTKQLKAVAHSIFESLVFDDDSFATSNAVTNNDQQNIYIDEIGVSFLIPNGVKWVTRTKGDFDYIGNNYHQQSSAVSSYMELNDYYFRAVDPQSSLRLDVSKVLASFDSKDTILMSDEDILYGSGREQFDDLVDGLAEMINLIDHWVWRSGENAFHCILVEFTGLNQLILLSYTTNQGYHYNFMFRDTDEPHLRRVAESIYSSFALEQSSDAKEIELTVCGVTMPLPTNWILMNQSVEMLEGIGPSDNVILDLIDTDGTRRRIQITVADFASVYWENPSPVQRNLYDRLYGKSMVMSLLAGQGITETSTLFCGGYEYIVCRVLPNTPEDAVMSYISGGHWIKLEWIVPSNDALTDHCLIEITNFAGDLARRIDAMYY